MMAWAFAGYGDPVAGVPEPAGRALHLWADAARVEPDAFEADYASGGCSSTSFSAAELTPKAPLRHDDGLMAAAHAHTDDMASNGWFAHDSSDGTIWSDRVWSYYGGGSIAENISSGRSSPRSAVLSGWMCSSGHRANLMNGIYDDFGGAMIDSYATQNFGQSGGADPELRTAMHFDEGSGVAVYASFGATGVPTTMEAVVDGIALPMALEWGADAQGVYRAEVADSAGCHEYYVRAEVGGAEVRFPETGSYGWGACPWDDAGAEWLSGQLPPASASVELSTEAWSVGATVPLTASGVLPGSTVHFVLGSQEGTGPCPAVLGGLCVGVTGIVRYLGSDVADGAGEATVDFTVPGVAAGRTVRLQAIGDVGQGWQTSALVEVQVP